MSRAESSSCRGYAEPRASFTASSLAKKDEESAAFRQRWLRLVTRVFSRSARDAFTSLATIRNPVSSFALPVGWKLICGAESHRRGISRCSSYALARGTLTGNAAFTRPSIQGLYNRRGVAV